MAKKVVAVVTRCGAEGRLCFSLSHGRVINCLVWKQAASPASLASFFSLVEAPRPKATGEPARPGSLLQACPLLLVVSAFTLDRAVSLVLIIVSGQQPEGLSSWPRWFSEVKEMLKEYLLGLCVS